MVYATPGMGRRIKVIERVGGICEFVDVGWYRADVTMLTLEARATEGLVVLKKMLAPG